MYPIGLVLFANFCITETIESDKSSTILIFFFEVVLLLYVKFHPVRQKFTQEFAALATQPRLC